MNKPGCEAYQRGDQATCDRCGVTWDLNDDDPPQCKPVGTVNTTHDSEMIKIQELLKLDD